MRIDTEDVDPMVESAIDRAFYEYCVDHLVQNRFDKEVYEPFRRGVVAGWRGRIQQEQIKVARATTTCYCWSEACSQHHKPGDCTAKAEYVVEHGPLRDPVCGDCLTRNRTRHTNATKLGIL